MWIYRKCLILLLVGGMLFLPGFTSASWKDSACTTDSNVSCKDVSNNYTEPYCITNFNSNIDGNSDVNYAKDCIWPVLTNNLSSIRSMNMALDKFTTRQVVQQYCLSLLGESDVGRIYFAKPSREIDSWDWQQTFDSHQSLFLYALCSSFKEEGKTPFIGNSSLLEGVFKGDLVGSLKLQQLSEGKDLCSLDANYGISECDMSVYATKIYEGIMSDIFKIKYAQVLHVDSVENFDEKENIRTFMKGYYKIDNDYKTLKEEYPKTISILASDQQYYRNVLKTVKYLDNTNLANLASGSQCPETGNMVGMHFVACALHSSQGKGSALTPSFVTLLYNEILNYRQFVVYYQEWIAKKIQKQQGDNLQEKSAKILESMSLDFQGYFNKQMEATKLVQHGFEEFSMTYPLHVWLLMYIEKGEKYRSVLSKVITSFYSLSEKLQNVQVPN